MKFIITGGAGFIGSAVIRHIINNTNHNVVNVDKLTYAGNLESLKSIEDDSRYVFDKVDICDVVEIKRVFNEYQPDIVMHLAAESHVDRSIDDPSEFIQTNIVGTYVLLEQAKDSGKSSEIIDKMVEGRLRKFYEEVVLGEQIYVIDGENKVDKVIEVASKEIEAPIRVSGFLRFELGEGIEKPEKILSGQAAS